MKGDVQKQTLNGENLVEKHFYCIKLSFLEQKNFKVVYQNALRLNKSYQTFSQTIESYFKSFHEYCSHIKEPSEHNVNFLYLFRKYLYDHSKIMSRITEYQISCFEAIRTNKEEDSLSMALHEIIESAKKYAPNQKEIRQKKQTLTTQFTNIKIEYMNLQKKMKKPKYLYDKKMMAENFQGLKSKISTNQKGQQAILSQIITIDSNTNSYFTQVNHFRKQLLKNKYKFLKKFVDLALNSRESLAELFYYQYNCLNDYYQTIETEMQYENDQFSILRADKTYRNIISDASGCMGVIIKNTQNFLIILQNIENDLRTTEKNFQMITKQLKQYEERGLTKYSFQQINNFFEMDQSPVQLMLDTISTFQYCFRKISEKGIDFKKAVQQIQTIRKEITKHKGITISLLKVKLKNGGLDSVRNILNNSQASDQCGVHQFMDSLNLKPVKAVIKNILDKLLFTFGEILTFFNQKSKTNKRFGIADSMELSYIEKSLVQAKKKKPIKDQLWLWDDYKKKVDTQFTLSKELFNQIFKIHESFKQNGQIDLNIEKYDCYCDEILENGELCISRNAIKFIAKQSKRQLYIPLSDIEEVKQKTKIVIKDCINIRTKIGELVFSQFQNTAQVEQVLKEIIQTGGAPKAAVQKRPKIQLTDGEKVKLQSQSRKQQIQKIRPNVSQFQQVQTQVFENFGIDEFYDLILSDKKFSLTGKEHDSFLVYAMKKMKNKDFKITKFQPPGPKYYTLDENTTFQNGPLMSQCTFDFVHLLDIPFMPSQCTNHDDRQIFWVSDKELDYKIHAVTRGVPMSQNFYVEIVYKIKEQNNNTILKVFANIKFLKSFALKSTVESGTWKEIKEGNKITLIQMEKGVNLYKTLLSGKSVQQEEQPDAGEVDSKNQVQKLKKRNLYLMIVVGIVILLNIVWKIFF